MKPSRSIVLSAACIVAFQTAVMVAVWVLDPLLLSSQRNIGIMLASSIMLYGAMGHLFLVQSGLVSRNLQWTAAAVAASFGMLVFIIFPYL